MSHNELKWSISYLIDMCIYSLGKEAIKNPNCLFRRFYPKGKKTFKINIGLQYKIIVLIS